MTDHESIGLRPLTTKEVRNFEKYIVAKLEESFNLGYEAGVRAGKKLALDPDAPTDQEACRNRHIKDQMGRL